MGRRSKPGVDWNEVQRAFITGESTRSIGERHGVSHTAVQNRARKHNWQVSENAGNFPPEIVRTETARAAVAPKNGYQVRQINLGKCIPENATVILAKVRDGVLPHTAAAMCGLKAPTFHKWCERDDEFGKAIAAAAGDARAEVEGAIHRVSKSGDARAGKEYLSAHERGTWTEQSRGSGTTINVQLNVDYDKRPEDIEDATPHPHVIEHGAG